MTEISIIDRKKMNILNRIDSEYYEKKLVIEENNIKKNGFLINEVFEEETTKIKNLNKKDLSFNYLEISNINTHDGTYYLEKIEWKNAPSRAQKVGKKNQVAISTVRPYRSSVALLKDDCICTSGLVLLKPKSYVTSEELFIYLKSKLFTKQVSRRTRATMYPAVDNNDILELVMPKLDEKFSERIVKEISEKHELENQLIKKENQIEILCSKFIQNYFKNVPINYYNNHSIKIYNKNDLYKESNNRLDSEYYQDFHSKIDKLFNANKDYYILNSFFGYIDTGSTPSKKFQAENETTDYFILKASSLSNKGLIWGKVENITEDYFNKKESSKIKQNDILVLCAAHSSEQIGKKISVIEQIENDKGNTITVGELITLRIENNDKKYLNFTYQYLKSEYGYLQIQRLIRGITSHLYPTDLKKIKVPYPSKDLLTKIDNISFEINKLRLKRDKIIQNLINDYNKIYS